MRHRGVLLYLPISPGGLSIAAIEFLLKIWVYVMCYRIIHQNVSRSTMNHYDTFQICRSLHMLAFYLLLLPVAAC